MVCCAFVNPYIDSAQTVCKIRHLDHAYNQRVVKNGWIEFAFPLRRNRTGKQAQPDHYSFGNLIITKTDYFLRTNDFFGKSVGIEIPWVFGIDIDYEDDLAFAERWWNYDRPTRTEI